MKILKFKKSLRALKLSYALFYNNQISAGDPPTCINSLIFLLAYESNPNRGFILFFLFFNCIFYSFTCLFHNSLGFMAFCFQLYKTPPHSYYIFLHISYWLSNESHKSTKVIPYLAKVRCSTQGLNKNKKQ